MRLLRATRGPVATAAVGLFTTGFLVFVGMTFLETKPVVAYVLLGAAAFRLFRVFVDFGRARRRAVEHADQEDTGETVE